MNNDNQLFNDEEVIAVYTSNQAVEDGILFDLRKSRFLANEHFNFVTINLLQELGIIKYDGKRHTDVVNISQMLDLIEQAKRIVIRGIEASLQEDSFYCGDIRKHNGERIKIFIEMNETGKLTLLLPSDH